jgi:microcystin degradation protein MlrC
VRDCQSGFAPSFYFALTLPGWFRIGYMHLSGVQGTHMGEAQVERRPPVIPRIAVGGFQHETNTFAPVPATYATFELADGWPALSRGPALIPAVEGINIPASGFIEEGRKAGWDLIPLLWASATPSAQVTSDAFERISSMILEDLAAALPVDGVYLDLHGAMVTEQYDDGEGELLRRVRAVIGPDTPLIVSLDLHANVTPLMAELADRLVIYRTYPHIDMSATGARAAGEMARFLAGTAGRAKVFRQIPFLIPLTLGCTLVDPAGAIYRRLEALEARAGVGHLSFACGFCPADIHDCGPSLVAYGSDVEPVTAAADALAAEVLGREGEFKLETWDTAPAVEYARAQVGKGKGPIVLADSQDNPGGGGNSDTVWILEELIRQGAAGAVVALLYDPEAAAMATQAGEGAELDLALGALSGQPGHKPLKARFKVLRVADGNFTATGPFFAGARMALGPTVLLDVEGVRVIVTSAQEQAADQEMFRHVGIEPAKTPILVLKSSVHFRADFQPIAAEILLVEAPGPVALDNRTLDFKKLRRGLRIMPGGPVFEDA